MNFIHILLSLLFAHVATAQSGHGIGNSHGHSVDKRGAFAPSGDGVCYTYTIQPGDTCAKLAERYKITTSDIETWNTGSWGWSGCANVTQGNFVCLSSGALPMPVALPQATCGPQVPGTRRPGNYADLASLNPCPKDQCCARSGKCGTGSAFCYINCLSNCGTKSQQKNVTTKSAPSKTTTSKTSTLKTTTAPKPTSSKTTTSEKKADMVTLTSIKLVPPPSKTTTSVAPTATWQMTIYEDDKCEGDYFSIQGHEDQNTGNCIILAEDTNTKISDTTTSCRWWSDGGLDWHTCASSKVSSPNVWLYSGKKCRDEDWIGETYPPFKGCQNHKTGYLSPRNKAWGALQCFEYVSDDVY
ncbi:hypothetical protein N7519_000505 [Penicillium mononematosum]|uniref:uncharacterized protein n=1 Tax=Penicillium mononematosum TaxID=268346 RepID=UPI0025468D14|nr:uncharacterized protein N7519_000505 [Penicillium mononematosum]KAJ6190484.1 hypothetical protein N7519_000505 [Penicillium mononematosum]